MSSSSPLRPTGEIRLLTEDGRCVLHLRGEIDTAVVTAFEADTGAAVRHRERIDVIDAADVTFLNSVGVRALIQLTEPARSAGHRPVLRRPSKATLQVLRVARLDELFDVID
ncbi:STAS domain-containing protein [Geodermatophilus sp. URMC 64]